MLPRPCPDALTLGFFALFGLTWAPRAYSDDTVPNDAPAPGADDPPAESPPADAPPTPDVPFDISQNANSGRQTKEKTERVPASQVPINPRSESDFTAYTMPKGHVKLGLVNLDWGALSNVHVGTAPALFLVGYQNVHVKITAIQSPSFDLSIFSGIGRLNRTFGEIPFKAIAYPVDVTGSILASDNISFHGGLGAQNFEISSEIGLNTLAEGLGAIAGTDVLGDLQAGEQGTGGLYGGGHVSLVQPHLAADYRFNGRHSLIYQWRGTTWLGARLDAGYEAGDSGVQVGVAARIRTSLKEQAIGTHTVSWQRSGERWHLRLGIGWASSALKIPGAVLIQANELYVLL